MACTVPPCARIAAPLMAAARSPARKVTTLATSAGLASRPIREIGQAAGNGQLGCLAGAIVRHGGHWRQRDFAGNKHDPAMATLQHRVHMGPRKTDAAPDIDLEHALPGFVVRLEKVAQRIHAQVIDQDVDVGIGRRRKLFAAERTDVGNKWQCAIAGEACIQGGIEMFCKAAELESFATAAEVLGATPAAVSRSIGRLPSGVLRISVPTTYGHFRVLPLLPRFQEAYPDIEFDIDISNRNIDFVEAGFDLAIRLGEPSESRSIALRLENASLGVFAAPVYLKRYGTRATLNGLRQHCCIQFVLPSSGRPMPWLFKDPMGQDVDFAFDSRQRIPENALGCVSRARSGGGVCQIYHFIASEAVARGELAEIMRDSGGRSRPFSILYPQNRHLSARVRAFVDFLVHEMAVLDRPPNVSW